MFDRITFNSQIIGGASLHTGYAHSSFSHSKPNCATPRLWKRYWRGIPILRSRTLGKRWNMPHGLSGKKSISYEGTLKCDFWPTWAFR